MMVMEEENDGRLSKETRSLQYLDFLKQTRFVSNTEMWKNKTAQHSTAQHSTAQHSTAQHTAVSHHSTQHSGKRDW